MRRRNFSPHADRRVFRNPHRLEKRDHFRASARPANIAGPGLSFTGAFNVESQAIAFP
jgi:hypothetical protein